MKKLIILSLLVSLGLVTIQAQEKGHYFDLNYGIGYHSLQYDLDAGSHKGGLGDGLFLGYSYFFDSRWGISTGVGLQSFTSKGKLNYLSVQGDTDSEGAAYDFRTYYNNWEEEQKAIFLDIPLGISHMVKLNDDWKLRGTLGAKISLPLSSTYESAGGNFETRGYYDTYNVEIFGIPDQKFKTITSIPEDDYEFDPVYAAFADFGAMYKLKDQLDLYLGVYASYGLNSAMEAKAQEPYLANETYKGVLASNQVGDVIPLSVGVKVGLTWRCKAKDAKVVEEIITTLVEKQEPVEEPIVEEAKPDTVVVVEPVAVVEPEPVVEPQPVVEKEKDALDLLDMPVIRFKFGTDEIEGDPQETILKALANRLSSNKDAKLHLIGHTDNKGSRSVNLRVGLKRANTIKQKLVNLGVSDSQITTESKAFDEPLVPNTSEENMAINRRVEFILEE